MEHPPPIEPSPERAGGLTPRVWLLAAPRAEGVGAGRILGIAGVEWVVFSPRNFLHRADRQRRPHLAVVTLDGLPPWAGDPLKAIERLRRNGFHVVAAHDRAGTWSVRERSGPMLAGAAVLLDSSRPEFVAELGSALAGLLRADREALQVRSALIAEMRGLGMAGASDRWLDIFSTVRRVGQLSDLPVLVSGETGCGKELLVRAIHRLDPKRREGPWVAVDCGAISAELAESELFGHRRGSFTGADRDRPGWFRAAHAGVLFLDEIGELPPRLQEKLLRVLQEGRVRPVGEDRDVAVDVRVVAATNRHLPRLVAEGRFREDLYHRLAVFTIHVPPLRERLADLRPLILHFIGKHASLAPAVRTVRDDFVEALSLTDLPGNARQVENLVRQSMVNHRAGEQLSFDDLPRSVWQELAQPAGATPPAPVRDLVPPLPRAEPGPAVENLLPAGFPGTLAQCLARYEKLLLQRALMHTRGNQSETARLLGITPRSVYNKLRKHCLTA